MKGGAYRSVREADQGGEVHHMPAAAASPLTVDQGPAIWMETEDHHQTASWGRSRGAMIYRKRQQDLIRQDRFSQLRDWFQSIDHSVEVDETGLTSFKFGVGLYAPFAKSEPDAPVEGVILFEEGYYE